MRFFPLQNRAARQSDSAPLRKTPGGRLSLPTVQGTALIQIAEIEYVQADDKYVKLVLASGEKFLITYTLKDLEALLPDTAFLRVHQSFIVHIDAVRKIQKMLGGITLLLKSKTAIPVSRRNKSAVSAN